MTVGAGVGRIRPGWAEPSLRDACVQGRAAKLQGSESADACRATREASICADCAPMGSDGDLLNLV